MSGERVLVVDDERHILKILEYNLKKRDYQVDSATNGIQALEKVESFKPQAILMDWMMPEMDGLEACKHLRANPDTKDIPIIMLTAKGQEIDRERGVEEGATLYMTKPFSPKELIKLLEQVLADSKEG
jgi:DNA-binding response OmpR family regulator